MKFIKKILVLSFIFSIALGNNVFAATEGGLALKNLKVSSNGAVVNSEAYSDYSIDIKMSSYKLKKAYYTTSVFNNSQLDLSNCGMISFDLNNKSNDELRFNFIMIQTDGTSLSVANDKSVLIKTEGQNIMQEQFPSYGTLSVPKGFKGTIFVPFSSLGRQGLNKQDGQYEPSSAASIGIISTLHEDEQKEFVIGDFKEINKADPMVALGALNITINGDARVQLPVVGESIARYKVEVDNPTVKAEKITYRIHDKQKGVSIGSDGILKIETGVPQKSIQIDAVVGNSIYVSKDIELFKSWTLSAKEVDGTSKSIPQPSAVKNLMSGPYEFIMSTSVMNIIRGISILAVVIIAGLYVYWNKTTRKL